jgi:hypothetical protein
MTVEVHSLSFFFLFKTNSYECPDLTSRDASKCYYNNEVLSAGEYLKSTKLGGQCSAACYCQKQKNRAELQCAHVDCPEYFGGSGYAENCIRQYDKGHCCAIKTICGNFSIYIQTSNGD